MLVEVNRDEVFTKAVSPKGEFAVKTLKEFYDSKMDCAKVTNWEHLGTFNQISSALRNKTHEYKGSIKVKTKNQEIYLLRESKAKDYIK